MKRITLFLLILSIAAFLNRQAEAQGGLPYSSGDLLMVFWATSLNGSSQDYLIDLGQVTNFENLAPGASITLLSSSTSSIGNINADLKSVFGTNWIQDTSLNWAVAGVGSSGDPTNTMYASIAESTPGTIEAGWDENTSHTQGTPYGKINGIGTTASSQDTPTTNSGHAVIQNDSDTSSWESYMAASSNGDTAFAYFNGGIGGPFGIAATTAGDTPLDLYQLKPGSNTTEGNYLGTFTIDSIGDLTFTNEEAVPEPATYGLLISGLGAFALMRRRGLRGFRS